MVAREQFYKLLLEEYSSFVYALLLIAGAALAIRVYQRPGSPTYKLVWMCLLLAMPVSGMAPHRYDPQGYEIVYLLKYLMHICQNNINECS